MGCIHAFAANAAKHVVELMGDLHTVQTFQPAQAQLQAPLRLKFQLVQPISSCQALLRHALAGIYLEQMLLCATQGCFVCGLRIVHSLLYDMPLSIAE